MNRTDRLLGYLLVLQGRSLVTAQYLAKHFEISERTVYRDIQALSEVGVPIAGMPGEGYRLMEGYYLPPISFTEGEARALYLSLSLFGALAKAGATRQASLNSFDKIRAVLPRASREQLESWQSILQFFAYPTPQVDFDDSRFLTLQESIEQRRLVQLCYHAESSNQVTERQFEPLSLFYSGQVWLVAGYCRLRQAMRNFRLDRIDQLDVLSETFAPREPEVRTQWPTETVLMIRFDKDVVRWVQERQHFTYLDQKDCGDSVEMRYSVLEGPSMLAWLLQWGESFEVVSPLELREEMRIKTEAMFHRHQS